MTETTHILGTAKLRTIEPEAALKALLEAQECLLREHFNEMWKRASQVILARKARTKADFSIPDLSDFEAKLPLMLAQFERVARAEFISGNLPGDFSVEDSMSHILGLCIDNPSTQLLN